jgi:hypothetical protein
MAAVKQNNKPRKSEADSARKGVGEDLPSGREEQPATDLHLSSRSSLTDMTPGDIIFLDDFTYLRETFCANFVAVLACPLCGSAGLITIAQFSGGGPIVCTSKTCSGQFRIVDETHIVPLPPN